MVCFLFCLLGATIRSPNDGDNDDSQEPRKSSTYSQSKDKDMRISAFLLEKDFANGDIDLRLPFKPVMANYIPATEIDASITSHAPIAYAVSNLFRYSVWPSSFRDFHNSKHFSFFISVASTKTQKQKTKIHQTFHFTGERSRYTKTRL